MMPSNDPSSTAARQAAIGGLGTRDRMRPGAGRRGSTIPGYRLSARAAHRMHCLRAFQAENRLHTIKAVLVASLA